MERRLVSKVSAASKIALIVVSTLLALLVGEAIVRLVAPQSVAVPWQDEVNGIAAPRPNVRGRHSIPDTFDVTISVNSQRFRNTRDFTVRPEPGVLRIAMLGDSFTFGYGANNNESYPAQLGQILKGKLTDRVEVINAGNGGTGTGEQAIWYETWVKRFEPEVVVLTVVPNDLDDDRKGRFFVASESGEYFPRSLEDLGTAAGEARVVRAMVNAVPGYAFLAQHFQLVNFLRNRVSRVIADRREAAVNNGGAPQANGTVHNFQEEGLDIMAGEISWLRRRVSESGAKLAVVFTPFREGVYVAGSQSDIQQKSNAIVKTLREICLLENIPFKDLTPEIRHRAKNLSEPMYYEGNIHPTPAGYRAIAESAADFLIENQIVSGPWSRPERTK